MSEDRLASMAGFGFSLNEKLTCMKDYLLWNLIQQGSNRDQLCHVKDPYDMPLADSGAFLRSSFRRVLGPARHIVPDCGRHLH